MKGTRVVEELEGKVEAINRYLPDVQDAGLPFGG
jgi:hypothetical protein